MVKGQFCTMEKHLIYLSWTCCDIVTQFPLKCCCTYDRRFERRTNPELYGYRVYFEMWQPWLDYERGRGPTDHSIKASLMRGLNQAWSFSLSILRVSFFKDLDRPWRWELWYVQYCSLSPGRTWVTCLYSRVNRITYLCDVLYGYSTSCPSYFEVFSKKK